MGADIVSFRRGRDCGIYRRRNDMPLQIQARTVDFDRFVKNPRYYVKKYPDQFLLLMQGEKLECVNSAAALYENFNEMLNIDWSKK